MKGLYLYIDLLTLAGPLFLSFDKRVRFYQYWKALITGILVMMLVFIPWDIAFTNEGIWGFNERYLTGVSLFNLPLEEWLFFIVVPYACVFIYACVLSYFPKVSGTSNLFFGGARLFALTLIAIGAMNYGRLYTSITFLMAGFYLLYHVYRQSHYLRAFIMAYLISLIPFLIVNGVLTGTGIDSEIVWYNNHHNMGLRLITIPIEDTIYSLLMLLITTHVFETLKKPN